MADTPFTLPFKNSPGSVRFLRLSSTVTEKATGLKQFKNNREELPLFEKRMNHPASGLSIFRAMRSYLSATSSMWYRRCKRHPAPQRVSVWLYGLTALFLRSLGFVALLVLPITWPSTHQVETFVATGAVVAIFLPLITFAFRPAPHPAFAIAGAAACIMVFAIPLGAAWYNGVNNGAVIGGLIPFSDASGYLTGTWQLLSEETLNRWNMRRPINAALHALRWSSADGNLMLSFAWMAWLIALGSLLAAAFIRRDLGWTAAIVFVARMAAVRRSMASSDP